MDSWSTFKWNEIISLGYWFDKYAKLISYRYFRNSQIILIRFIDKKIYMLSIFRLYRKIGIAFFYQWHRWPDFIDCSQIFILSRAEFKTANQEKLKIAEVKETSSICTCIDVWQLLLEFKGEEIFRRTRWASISAWKLFWTWMGHTFIWACQWL